MSTNKFLIDS